MEREIIKEGQRIIERIDANKTAISELEKYEDSGKTLYTDDTQYRGCFENFPIAIFFEDWEIRLMIHNKKQRIAALEKQLEQL